MSQRIWSRIRNLAKEMVTSAVSQPGGAGTKQEKETHAKPLRPQRFRKEERQKLCEFFAFLRLCVKSLARKRQNFTTYSLNNPYLSFRRNLLP
jgi:hypothetical protein